MPERKVNWKQHAEVDSDWGVHWESSLNTFRAPRLALFLPELLSSSPSLSVYILLKLQEAIFKPVPQIETQECTYVRVGGWVIARDSGRGPTHHKQSVLFFIFLMEISSLCRDERLWD